MDQTDLMFVLNVQSEKKAQKIEKNKPGKIFTIYWIERVKKQEFRCLPKKGRFLLSEVLW